MASTAQRRPLRQDPEQVKVHALQFDIAGQCPRRHRGRRIAEFAKIEIAALDGEIPLSSPQAENIVDQVTEYFSGEQAPAKVADAQAAATH